MMTALVLLFLVSPGESDAQVTLAMRQAAIQVLGPATAVVIREAPDGLQDVAAIEHGDALHAVVIVRLTWTSRTYLRAQLRLHQAGTIGWTTREVAFEPKDVPGERGRALGYSVAAVVAEGAPPGAAYAHAALRTATAADPRAAQPLTSDEDVAATAGSPSAVERSFFLDASGTASTGFGGSGGHVRLGWSLTKKLRLMVGGGARVGTAGAAQATSTHLYATAGAAFDLISFWRIDVACRAEALLVRQSLSHFSLDDPTAVKRARWLPGFRPQLETSLWLSGLTAIIVSAGWELTAGSTDVYVRGDRVMVIPASRAVGELGLRVHF